MSQLQNDPDSTTLKYPRNEDYSGDDYGGVYSYSDDHNDTYNSYQQDNSQHYYHSDHSDHYSPTTSSPIPDRYTTSRDVRSTTPTNPVSFHQSSSSPISESNSYDPHLNSLPQAPILSPFYVEDISNILSRGTHQDSTQRSSTYSFDSTSPSPTTPGPAPVHINHTTVSNTADRERQGASFDFYPSTPPVLSPTQEVKSKSHTDIDINLDQFIHFNHTLAADILPQQTMGKDLSYEEITSSATQAGLEDEAGALQAHMLLLDAAAAILSENVTDRTDPVDRTNKNDPQADPQSHHGVGVTNSNHLSISLADLDACRREQRLLNNRMDLLKRKRSVQRRVRDAAALVDKIGGDPSKRDSQKSDVDRSQAREEAGHQYDMLDKELDDTEKRLLQIQNKVFRGVVAAAVGFGGPGSGGGEGGESGLIKPTPVTRFPSNRQRILIPDKWDSRNGFCSPEQLEMVFTPGLIPTTMSSVSQSAASSAQLTELDHQISRLKQKIQSAVSLNPSTSSDDENSERDSEISDVEDITKSLNVLEQHVSDLLTNFHSTKQTAQHNSGLISSMNGVWDIVRATELQRAQDFGPDSMTETVSDPTFSIPRLSAVTQHIVSARSEGESRQREHLANIAAHKTENDLLKSDLLDQTRALASIREELSICQQSIPALESARVAAEKELAVVKGEEMPRLESELVRIQTALTICRAELDRGDGPRSERVARDHRIDEFAVRNSELVDQMAKQRVESEKENFSLRRELATLLSEFEELTKVGLRTEQERVKLESQVDRLIAKLQSAEGRLADEKVRVLGRNANSPHGFGRIASPAPGEGTDMSQALVPISRPGDPAHNSRRSPSPSPSHNGMKQLPPIPGSSPGPNPTTSGGGDGLGPGHKFNPSSSSSGPMVLSQHPGGLVRSGSSQQLPPPNMQFGQPEAENIPTQVLRAEFKKMMRDVRAEGLRALRDEQVERKKLEAELRSLRMERLDAAAVTAATAAAAGASAGVSAGVTS